MMIVLRFGRFSVEVHCNYATLAEPLRKLTRKDVPWCWGENEQRSFDALKQAITSTDVMAYYNENAETNLLVDGSPFGLGAILTQKQPDGDLDQLLICLVL